MTDIITEEQLSLFAADLVERLSVVDRAIEIEERRQRRAGKHPIGPWLCESSHLDFMARPGHEFAVPITAEYTVKHGREFRSHIALCSRCTTREECEELGAGEKYGIWGGTLPHERMERR